MPMPVTRRWPGDAEPAPHELGLLLGEEAERVAEPDEPLVDGKAQRRLVVGARVEHERRATGERRDRFESGEVQVREHHCDIERPGVVTQPLAKPSEPRPLLSEPRMLHVDRCEMAPREGPHRGRGEALEVARLDGRQTMHPHAVLDRLS